MTIERILELAQQCGSTDEQNTQVYKFSENQLLKFVDIILLELGDPNTAEDKEYAARYRWLRQQGWDIAELM